eukprot:TRINITY_DN8154_c0_g1_i1.p1 TRINITY_DN8154_c0_g1~~TRINITY_DN8154_c0_g1_i1.p1  ORF type:complete len:199 (+),score=-11.27 TRINITY_DN8154_c0_g1_i1:1196-1792(+)
MDIYFIFFALFKIKKSIQVVINQLLQYRQLFHKICCYKQQIFSRFFYFCIEKVLEKKVFIRIIIFIRNLNRGEVIVVVIFLGFNQIRKQMVHLIIRTILVIAVYLQYIRMQLNSDFLQRACIYTYTKRKRLIQKKKFLQFFVIVCLLNLWQTTFVDGENYAQKNKYIYDLKTLRNVFNILQVQNILHLLMWFFIKELK